MTDESLIEQVRQIVVDHARLPEDAAAGLPAGASLYDAGMTSHASVSVMLAVEDHFDIEFPDSMLTRSVFESIESIGQALEQLRAGMSV